MKKLLTLASFVVLAMSAKSQLVITEIMYNPPEAGTDSLEYIEIYNNSQASVDLSRYYIDQGVTDSFPAIMLPAGGYFVTAVNATGFNNAFGSTPHQWITGGLSNGGEDIVIKEVGTNAVIDSVMFDDVAPWDSLTDGEGYSLELCDVNADNNDGANWKKSATMVSGLVIEGKQVYASPGMANAVSCSATSSIEELEMKNVTVYPNPVAAGETLRFSENITGVIINITGKQVANIVKTNQYNTSGLERGVYFVRTQSFTKRFIVK